MPSPRTPGTRPTGKPRRSTRYDNATRERALTLYQTDGLPTAATTTGVSKQTITRWARAAGVDPADVTERARKQTEAAAAAAVAARHARVQGILDGAVDKLAEVVDEALTATLAGLRGEDHPAIRSTTVTEDGKTVVVPGWANPRQLTGMWTRALHDLRALMGGDADQPTPTGMVVVFATETPAAGEGEAPTVIDLQPLSVRDDREDIDHG